MFFQNRKLTTVGSLREQARLREALAGAGIASTARAGDAARAAERRARMGGGPAGEDGSYEIRVRKSDYVRAAQVLRSLGRNG